MDFLSPFPGIPMAGRSEAQGEKLIKCISTDRKNAPGAPLAAPGALVRGARQVPEAALATGAFT
ncbi:hypothetical protein GCM10010402_47220 [Actinomadura luteofluorescens]